jgi:putative salt-induced outer membrane protein YdiY
MPTAVWNEKMMPNKLKIPLLLTLFCLVVLAAFSVEAEETEAADKPEPVKIEEMSEKKIRKMQWEQFVPPPDEKYDWIQLYSGEWLKGEFKTLYDHVIVFDSEEMNLQEFDFEDVKRLRTIRPQRILVGRERGSRNTMVEQGMLEIIGDKVMLRKDDQEVEISRRRLVSIATGEASRFKRWSGSIGIGANKRDGNSESTDSNVAVYLQRSMARSRFVADYLGVYSSTDGDKTVDNHRLSTYFDWFLTTKSYWQILYAEYYRDTFINIDNQVTLGTGYGYEVIRTPKTELTFMTGIGYQEQQYVSVEEDEDDHSGSPILFGGMHFDRDLTSRIEYIFDYDMRLLNDDNGRYTHHMISTISVDLVKDFDIDFSYIWDRIEKPQEDSDGELPEQDDYQFILSVVYDF